MASPVEQVLEGELAEGLELAGPASRHCSAHEEPMVAIAADLDLSEDHWVSLEF
jgi:hypothetical protein